MKKYILQIILILFQKCGQERSRGKMFKFASAVRLIGAICYNSAEPSPARILRCNKDIMREYIML